MVAKKEISDEELWNTISVEKQIEIDMAVDKGNKPEAVNRLMCEIKNLSLFDAKKFIERRAKVIPKKI